MNRLSGLGVGDIPTFALHTQHGGLGGGNVTLGPSSGNLGSLFSDGGITLFSSAQLGGLHSLQPHQHGGPLQHLASGQLHTLHQPSLHHQQVPDGNLRVDSPGAGAIRQLARPSRSDADNGSGLNSGKSSSAYASRHQAAEQRRRTRINERLDLLRKMVPHSDRANTASFLEEVLKYIDSLKARVNELEATLQGLKANGNGNNGNGNVPSAGGNRSSPNPSMQGAGMGLGSNSGLLRDNGGDYRGALTLSGNSLPGLPNGHQQQQQQQGGVNVSYCLQQLQQQQLQQLLQQQQDAALQMALQEEQQQKAALLAAQQLRQQQELAAARQANLADLATQLGLRTVSASQQGGSSAKFDSMDMLAKHGLGKEQRVGSMSLPVGLSHDQRSSGQVSHGNNNATLHILPVQQLQLHGPASDMGGAGGGDATHNSSAAAALTANLGPRKAGSGSSPVSSEESGVPLKKRKVLLL